ncbi:hypothetical protein [Prauserella rugosa]|uniref:Uncharacterized protein n=1 Tax=Prauserella rugosa TaxID=43354 RepID=A0A660CDW8_9PSEU|nr:hypothetical protein [Prauserella rugosa]KID28417.1 hypothetical protein HQ32_04323 [Prauserella sp. Am3]TWH20594.1 hypothetical protein JD82_02441 [Prauserella rugosa]
MPEPQRSPEPDAWPGQPEFDEPVEPDRHTGGRHRRDQPRHGADLPPDHPGHQEPFPRRRKPEGAAEQYPHETPRRYPGGGAHIEGVPEPPPRRTPDER